MEDRVADNSAKHDINESESLLIGRDFGVLTDIQTSPSGTLYVVSVSNGPLDNRLTANDRREESR